MFNNTYGDEGFTILFKEEISKSSELLDFLGELKEVKAYIKLSINFINPFKYYFVNDSLSLIINDLDNIEEDYINGLDSKYEIKSLLTLDNKINELKSLLNNYVKKDQVVNKISALMELIYTKCLKLERSYYKTNKTFKFQSYLNRLNDYFYLLKDYVEKEM